MPICKITVRKALCNEDAIYIPNDEIVLAKTINPFVWDGQTRALLIRGNKEELDKILSEIKSNDTASIRLEDLTAWHAQENGMDGASAMPALYVGYGEVQTTDKDGSGFLIGKSGIQSAILGHCAKKISGYLRGELTDLNDIIEFMFKNDERDSSEATSSKERCFIFTLNNSDSWGKNLVNVFEGVHLAYGDGTVLLDGEDNVQENKGIPLGWDEENGLTAISFKFKDIFSSL